MLQPSSEEAVINERLDAVEELLDDPMVCGTLLLHMFAKSLNAIPQVRTHMYGIRNGNTGKPTILFSSFWSVFEPSFLAYQDSSSCLDFAYVVAAS